MKTVLVDHRLPKGAAEALSRDDFRVVKLPSAGALYPSPIASHADMILFHHGTTVITSEEYRREHPELFEELEGRLPYYRFIYTEDRQSADYPRDAIYNALVIGDRLFCKTDTVAGAILDYAKEAGLTVINTAQGYPSCTVLSLGDRAVTADRGMARVLEKCGIPVYVISDSAFIGLMPYDYGFIGGSAGIHGGTVYFLGDVREHPDSGTILRAIADAGLDMRILPVDGGMLDLGRLIFCE